jgi:hypothetical protein
MENETMPKTKNNVKTPVSKAERKNSGKRGARRFHMSSIELLMLDKGPFSNIEPIKGPPYLGSVAVSNPPFDEVQAKKNRDAGY